jgi:hypothetical protein
VVAHWWLLRQEEKCQSFVKTSPAKYKEVFKSFPLKKNGKSKSKSLSLKDYDQMHSLKNESLKNESLKNDDHMHCHSSASSRAKGKSGKLVKQERSQSREISTGSKVKQEGG